MRNVTVQKIRERWVLFLAVSGAFGVPSMRLTPAPMFDFVNGVDAGLIFGEIFFGFCMIKTPWALMMIGDFFR